jgi:hypothetical protein
MSSGNVDASPSDVVSVWLVLKPDPELDLEASERLIRQLRAEFAELDIESVGLAGVEPLRMARRAPTLSP